MSTANEICNRAVNHVFGTGLAIAAIMSFPRVDAEVASRLRDCLEELDAAVRAIRAVALLHADTGPDTQAKPRPHSGPARPEVRLDVLLSAGSGEPLARRVGGVYYDHETDVPPYCERA